jgi:hypothetical protein
MGKFLDTYDHSKLNQEDISHLTRSITNNEIETAIKSLLKEKMTGPGRFTAEFYQTFKDKLTLLKLLQEINRMSNSSYEASITLIPQPEKDTTKKRELQANLFDELRCKNP